MRGFTLLEVVITLAIIIALGSLVMPAVSSGLGGQTGRSVQQDIRAAVGMARSDAIRTGEASRVVFVRTADGRSLRLVSRPLHPTEPAETRPRFVGPVLDDPAPMGAGATVEKTEELLLELPRGASVSRVAPAPERWGDAGSETEPGDPDRSAMDSPADGADWGSLGAGDRSAGTTIGVLLPTGGAVPGSPVYIELPGSWTLVVTLDGWTGDAIVTRWEPSTDENEFGSGPAGGAGVDSPSSGGSGQASESGRNRRASVR